MTYLLVFVIGAGCGAYLNLWWQDYLADTGDQRSIERRSRAAQAIRPRRWN